MSAFAFSMLLFVLAAPPADDQALARCRQALTKLNSVAPASKAVFVAEHCKELFPAGPCRKLLGDLEAISPEARAAQIQKHCLLPNCKDRPDLCEEVEGTLTPSARLRLMRTIQGAMVGLSRPIVRAVPAATPKPAPEVIKVELQLTEAGPRVFWDLGKGRVSTKIEDIKKTLAGRKFDQVVIQAGKKVPYGALIQVMDALRAAGIEEFSIAPTPVDEKKP
ncbi:MAG: biopolymer transporter ExbD [Deltaproteobacteria bacterium]|nr:biopolymer transporter ExbD [Deltaproteobacteria bacterium]